jgi:hypothetical protein
MFQQQFTFINIFLSWIPCYSGLRFRNASIYNIRNQHSNLVVPYCMTSNNNILFLSLFSVNIFRPSLNILHHCLTVLDSLHFDFKEREIYSGFPQHSCFCVKKADKSANSVAGGNINRTTHYNSVETRTNITWPVMWWFTMLQVMYAIRMRELSPAPILLA